MILWMLRLSVCLRITGATYLAFCWKYDKVYLYFEKVRKQRKKWGFKKTIHKNYKIKIIKKKAKS